MYIRRQGLNFQLLRRIDLGDDKIHHERLGLVPVTCKSIEEIGQEILGKLTKREEGHLEEHLEKHLKKQQRGQQGTKSKELDEVMGEMEVLLEKYRAEKSELDINILIPFFKRLTYALCNSGKTPITIATTLKIAKETIEGIELEAEEAAIMIKEWVRLRKSLNKQGYTSKWYNIWKGVENNTID